MAGNYTIILKKDISSTWGTTNSILDAGEPGVETDTGKIKVGDGSKSWNTLPYSTDWSRYTATQNVTLGSNSLTNVSSIDGLGGVNTSLSATGMSGTNYLTLGGYIISSNPTGPRGVTGGRGITGPKGLDSTLGITLRSNQTIASGYQAGLTGQGQSSISIGYQAGQSKQGPSSLAIGYQAGQSNQRVGCVAVGSVSGKINQGNQSLAIGFASGNLNQGANSVAIGSQAGATGQGVLSVAIGCNAADQSQGTLSVAIGPEAAYQSQATQSVAIGLAAGRTNQATQSLAIGFASGNLNQATQSVAIGVSAGRTNQGTQSVALGLEAGSLNQGIQSVALGYQAGSLSQASQSVALGYLAGYANQGSQSVAIGSRAGQTNQPANTIILNASGTEFNAGQTGAMYVKPIRKDETQNSTPLCYNPNTAEIVVGPFINLLAGVDIGITIHSNQSLALGFQSGISNQGSNSFALGINSGLQNQGSNSVAIGSDSGLQNQGSNSVAIGNLAGYTRQGGQSVAIGYKAGQSDQPANTIILNATNTALNGISGQTGSFYVNPIRSDITQTRALCYNPSTGEIVTGLPSAVVPGFNLNVNKSFSLGSQSGITGQGAFSVAIGYQAGQSSQGINSIALGNQAGLTGQGSNSVAIGNRAGVNLQGTYSVALGTQAGQTGQGDYSVSAGFLAGTLNQGSNSLAIGYQAGALKQGSNSVAIGYQAGSTGQSTNSVAIGYQAGSTGQGSNSVAIGSQSGKINQAANTIILNATNTALNGVTGQVGSLYVKPIRTDLSQITPLRYHPDSGEIIVSRLEQSPTVVHLQQTETLTFPNLGYNYIANIIVIGNGGLRGLMLFPVDNGVDRFGEVEPKFRMVNTGSAGEVICYNDVLIQAGSTLTVRSNNSFILNGIESQAAREGGRGFQYNRYIENWYGENSAGIKFIKPELGKYNSTFTTSGNSVNGGVRSDYLEWLGGTILSENNLKQDYLRTYFIDKDGIIRQSFPRARVFIDSPFVSNSVYDFGASGTFASTQYTKRNEQLINGSRYANEFGDALSNAPYQREDGGNPGGVIVVYRPI